jgi:hypothetical protein
VHLEAFFGQRAAEEDEVVVDNHSIAHGHLRQTPTTGTRAVRSSNGPIHDALPALLFFLPDQIHQRGIVEDRDIPRRDVRGRL